MIEQTVPTGLNMDTKTGPLFSSAQALMLKHIPVTAPDCEFSIQPSFNIKQPMY